MKYATVSILDPGAALSKAVIRLERRAYMFFAPRWQRLEQVVFGLFMGSLVTLLILLYADVPVISGP